MKSGRSSNFEQKTGIETAMLSNWGSGNQAGLWPIAEDWFLDGDIVHTAERSRIRTVL